MKKEQKLQYFTLGASYSAMENIRGTRPTLKLVDCIVCVLVFLNIFYIVLGILSFSNGISMLNDDRFIQDLLGVSVGQVTAGCILSAMGLLLFVTSLSYDSIIKRIKSHMLLLIIFKSLMIIFFLTAAILCFVHINSSERTAAENLEKSLGKYKDDEVVRAAWDVAQKTLKCCGNNGYQDWLHESLPNDVKVPESCCRSVFDCTRQPYDYNTNKFGCFEKITESIKKDYQWAGSLAAGTSFLLMIGLPLVCWFYLWIHRDGT